MTFVPTQELAPCPSCEGLNDDPNCYLCRGTGKLKGITVRALLASLQGVPLDYQVSFILQQEGTGSAKETPIQWAGNEPIGEATFYLGVVESGPSASYCLKCHKWRDWTGPDAANVPRCHCVECK